MKRTVSIAMGVGALSIVAGATPAAAFWTADAQSNNLTVSAQAVQLGPFPTGSLTSSRPKKTPSFTVGSTAPAGLAGYHVTLVTDADATSGGTPVCDITGATGSCTSPTDYDGGRIFLITAFAGPWSARAAVCSYHDAGVTDGTCS